MKRKIAPTGKEEMEKGLIVFGREIIKRRKEILGDIENVKSITINMEINPCEVMSYEIIKERMLTIEDVVKGEREHNNRDKN